jgi:hypothetical protein
MYEPMTFVERLGYQPVEFLDIPRMDESEGATVPPIAPYGIERIQNHSASAKHHA